MCEYMTYEDFVDKFTEKIKAKYENQNVRIERWEHGKKAEDELTRKMILDCNWIYYGKQKDILEGDFLFVRISGRKREYSYKMELSNCFNCYQEEGWNGVMREAEQMEKNKEPMLRSGNEMGMYIVYPAFFIFT